MATTRIYIDLDLTVQKQLELPEVAGNHVGRVLRMRTSDPLILFNGKGGQFNAKIISVNRAKVKVEISAFSDEERESSIQIELGQSLSKGEKMDFTIQKAVELGISKITPLITSYSNVRLDENKLEKKLEHWRKVIISACEQCGRNTLPELANISKIDDWMTHTKADLKLLLAPDAESSLSDLDEKPETICVVIGPEGGLSRSENRSLENNGFIGIRLGPRILRTETAGLTAVAALQNQFGDY